MKHKVRQWVRKNASDEDKRLIDISKLGKLKKEILEEIFLCSDNDRICYLLKFFSYKTPKDIGVQRGIIKIMKQTEYFKDIYIDLVYTNIIEYSCGLQLLEIMANAKDESQFDNIRRVVGCEEVLASGYAATLAKLFANANPSSEDQGLYACSVATNIDVLKSGQVIELVKTVINAKEEWQAYYAKEVAENINVLASGKAVHLVKIVSNAVGEDQAFYSYNLATRKNILESGYAEELTSIVANAPDKAQTVQSHEVAIDEDLLARGIVVELARIIANAKDGYQSYYANGVATEIDIDILTNDVIIELVRIVANSIGEQQALESYEVAIDENVLASGKALELTTIVSNAVGENQAKCCQEVATNKAVLASDNVTELVTAIANAKSEKAALYAKQIIFRANELNFDNILTLVQKICSGEYLEQFEDYLYKKNKFMAELEDAYLSLDFKRFKSLLKNDSSIDTDLDKLAYRLSLKKNKN